MSEADGLRRMRFVAMSAAFVALVFTAIAVILVLVRDSEPAPDSRKREAVAPLVDLDVRAADVVRLQRSAIEAVVDNGASKGLRVKDPELARALGLADGDVLTSISGKAVTREFDMYSLMVRLATLEVTVVYVEVARND